MSNLLLTAPDDVTLDTEATPAATAVEVPDFLPDFSDSRPAEDLDGLTLTPEPVSSDATTSKANASSEPSTATKTTEKVLDMIDFLGIGKGGPIGHYLGKKLLGPLREKLQPFVEEKIYPVIAGKTGETVEKSTELIPFVSGIVKTSRALALFHQGEKLGNEEGEALKEQARRKYIVGYGKVIIDAVLAGAGSAAGAGAQAGAAGASEAATATKSVASIATGVGKSAAEKAALKKSLDLGEQGAAKLLDVPGARDVVDALIRRQLKG